MINWKVRFKNPNFWLSIIPATLLVIQLVLDLSRPEVAEAVYEEICAVLDSARIEYLKWDANRHIADLYSQDPSEEGGRVRPSGKILHSYVLGLYRILEQLRERYPGLLIEGCCGGGGRFDAGMLYYTPQIWCSDNTDPIDRLLIQYGTSFGYPPETMGAHVSASPNAETGRHTPTPWPVICKRSDRQHPEGQTPRPAPVSDPTTGGNTPTPRPAHTIRHRQTAAKRTAERQQRTKHPGGMTDTAAGTRQRDPTATDTRRECRSEAAALCKRSDTNNNARGNRSHTRGRCIV